MAKPDKLPRWASVDNDDPITGQANKVEPTESKKDDGWAYLEKPPFNIFNWLFNKIYEWVVYFSDRTDKIPTLTGDTTDDTETEIFIDGVTDSRVELTDGILTYNGLISAINDSLDLVMSWSVEGYLINNSVSCFNNYTKTMLTAWDVLIATYNSNNKDLSSQDATPQSVFFKSDGTKMYMVGITTDTVFEYDLSIAWDVSTASYNSNSKDVSAQDSSPSVVFLNTDGTKMYIVGNANKTIFEYALSTPWDVSTASYNSNSKDLSNEDTINGGVFFKSDGTKMYMTGNANKTIFEYALSTPWDVSTASYNSNNKDVSSEDTSPTNVFFKSDGTKMYVAGNVNDSVFSYDLSTPWDVSTAIYNGNNKDVSSEATSVLGGVFKSDGTKMYILNGSNGIIFEYNLFTGWDVNLEADSVNEALAIKVTGETGENISWKATLNINKNEV